MSGPKASRPEGPSARSCQAADTSKVNTLCGRKEAA
jgi:hypothetical protein